MNQKNQLMRKNQKIIMPNSYERNRNKRLFLMLLLLFAIGITLTSSSYAWFTSNRIASVWLMDVKVAAQNGIEISADGIKWGSEITIEELQDAHLTYPASVNQLPTILEPVSTIGEVEAGQLKMFYGKVENARNSSSEFILRATRESEERGYGDDFASAKYLAFDVFLKTNSATELYLSDESGVTYNGEESLGIENSMRFAFVIEGTTEENSTVSAIQLMRTSNRSNVYIWEPNYNIHTENAISNARDLYGINISSPSGVLQYEGVKAEIPKDAGVLLSNANKNHFPAYFDTVRVDYTSKVDFNDSIQVFNLGTGITKIRVYVWLEGQDIDCENSAADGGMKINLQFTKNPS